MKGRIKNPPSRAVLIHIPIGLLDRLDEAATELGLNRSELIRTALARDHAQNILVDILNKNKKKNKTKNKSEKPKSSWLSWR